MFLHDTIQKNDIQFVYYRSIVCIGVIFVVEFRFFPLFIGVCVFLVYLRTEVFDTTRLVLVVKTKQEEFLVVFEVKSKGHFSFSETQSRCYRC